MARRGKFEVLREPTYRRLFAGRTTSLIGDGLAPVAISFAVLDMTGSATDLGLVLAAHSLVVTALILFGGVVGDRVSPRVAMLWADVVRTVVTGIAAALLLAGVATIWQLALLYAIDGAATALFNPASSAIVPQIVPGERLQEANALLNLSRSLGKVVGPALAGILLALGSPGAALAFNALTFAISAAFLFGMRAPSLRDGTSTSFLAELRQGWSEFSSRTWLWVLVLSAGITNALYFPTFQVLGPTVADRSLGGSSAWALIATCTGIGALVGGGLALSTRPRRPLLAGEGAMLLVTLPIALLAVPAAVVVIALGSIVSGAVFSFAEILYETTIAQQVPPQSLSRVSAYDWFGSLALEPVGLALVGPVALGIGLSTTLWLAVLAMVLCQVAVLLVPGVRRMEARPGGFGAEPKPLPRPIEPGE